GRLGLVWLEAEGGAWSRFDRGTRRATTFGSETIVERPSGLEQFLTVDRHVGVRTWRWKLATPLAPQVIGRGVVRFVDPQTHRVSSLTIRPVQILAANG